MIRLLRALSVVALVLAVAVFVLAQIDADIHEDDTLPVIVADSDTLSIPCEYTTEQLLAGVTASDEKDGDLTGQILVGNFTRFIEPGICDLNYVVFDSSEHMATMTRRVHFTDYHSPHFGLTEPLVFAEGTTNSSDVISKFTANDVLDGDLTESISCVENSASYNTSGDYTITMEVANSFGDTVSYAFPVHIYERNSQNFDIQLTNALQYINQGDSFDPMRYIASVSDDNGGEYDPNLLQVTSTVDTSTPGIYEVHYEIGKASLEQEKTEDEQDDKKEEVPVQDEHIITSIEDDSLYGQMWLTVIVQEVRS